MFSMRKCNFKVHMTGENTTLKPLKPTSRITLTFLFRGEFLCAVFSVIIALVNENKSMFFTCKE